MADFDEEGSCRWREESTRIDAGGGCCCHLLLCRGDESRLSILQSLRTDTGGRAVDGRGGEIGGGQREQTGGGLDGEKKHQVRMEGEREEREEREGERERDGDC